MCTFCLGDKKSPSSGPTSQFYHHSPSIMNSSSSSISSSTLSSPSSNSIYSSKSSTFNKNNNNNIKSNNNNISSCDMKIRKKLNEQTNNSRNKIDITNINEDDNISISNSKINSFTY